MKIVTATPDNRNRFEEKKPPNQWNKIY